ncbi:flagellar type III secretion system pore protein FliP [Brevundimonas sp. Leaf363]|uniref:flagellar type III secretion system pore protein FliP n=1 Tax=Brevundimonas sp. Leaf363 TaxID=1736353 RepID=UPI0012E318A8
MTPKASGWGRPRKASAVDARPGRPHPAAARPALPGTGREKLWSTPTGAELKRAAWLSLFTTLACLLWPIGALAQEAAQAAATGSAINVDLGTGAGLTERVVQLVGLMTVLSLAPSIVIMTTSFVRIVVVLSLLRTALGLTASPPNAVLVSLALFLSAIVMAPTWQDAYDSGIRPLMDQQMELPQAFDAASEPVKTFMLAQVDRSDLALFTRLSQVEAGTELQDLPIRVVTPAFMISELKRAFEIGFLLFVPFLVIDLVVASVLMSMGMMMLPPVVVSLPFKLIFFVLVDGWRLVCGSLVESFQRASGTG